MNKKIKVLAILLVISIVASVTLYGCKKSESGNSVDVSYVVNCSLDDNAKVLYVATKITLRNNSSMTIDKIPFYLYPNAYIKDGGKVMVSNVKDGENDVEFNVDGINGTLKLNSLLLPSATKEIAISSRVSLPQGKKRLGHGDGYYNLHAFFPRVPFFDGSEFVVVPYSEVGDPYYFSQDDFVISIEYPVTYTLAHSGNRVSDEIKGEVVKSVFKIEDARDVACWVGEEKAVYEKDVDGVKIQAYQEEDYTEFIGNCIAYFSKEVGAYPFETFTLVETPFDYGGMEYSGFVTISDRVKDKKFVIAHEIIHQWFGLKVGSNSYKECWVDESLTNYLTYYYMDIYNKGGLKENMEKEQERYRKYIEYAKYEYGLGYEPKLTYELGAFRDEVEYANLVYGYGVLMYDGIRGVCGDEKFKKAVKEYYENYAGKVASGNDLIKSFSKSSGRKVDGVFRSYMENRTAF